ncbi:3-isopropylmalate dehydrogenase [Anaerobacterium chartisolvens]|uniref:3-isopropylmalate dehydrogenase n=1 Tax=Anaerobacterium chartisolvens TaxID=1297424 RepID=A0A369B053_9FIRM|nr:3-isopropylmalate dehydrogenase [Anaerobacterium chartisolvens]RCX14793.1 3-isopropylmalate dehydrogenase [Anaerobacterium chartisolvens]
MKFNITVLPGDGIGPEVTREAVEIINVLGEKYGHSFELTEEKLGGCAIDACGVPLPDKTLETCKSSHAVLLGAVGGPKWDGLPGNIRPEAGLLGIRGGLGLFANLRPAVIYSSLKEASPLRADIVRDGIDIMVVRELTGGIYFGKRGREKTPSGSEAAFDTEMYSTEEIERIARVGFESAMKRNKRLTSVDKANVLESSRLWREVVIKLSSEFPEVSLSHMYVDNAAMQLVRNPMQFDVIVTGNMFGDILSDEASMITGSIGMLPSASLGNGTLGLYEPIHGSAPDIAGQDKANPIAAILSVGMMMKYSLGLESASQDVETAVKNVLDKGYRTGDIASKGTEVIGTRAMGELIKKEII